MFLQYVPADSESKELTLYPYFMSERYPHYIITYIVPLSDSRRSSLVLKSKVENEPFSSEEDLQ